MLKSYHSQPFSIPHVNHDTTIKKRMFAMNGNRSVGTHSDISDYALPSLIIPNKPMAQDYKEQYNSLETFTS